MSSRAGFHLRELAPSVPPNRDREESMQEIGHFVAGARVGGTSGRSADVFNPATGEVQAHVGKEGAGSMPVGG